MGLFSRIRCPKCGARFSQKEEMMQHEQTVHGDESYSCKECGTDYTSMEDMRTHLQRMHSYKADR